jgi:hypothetical protein
MRQQNKVLEKYFQESTLQVVLNVVYVYYNQMPELPTTHTLEALYRRVAELEADLRVIGSTIQYLEHALGGYTARELDRADGARQHREIAQEVEADLFSEDLQNPLEAE